MAQNRCFRLAFTSFSIQNAKHGEEPGTSNQKQVRPHGLIAYMTKTKSPALTAAQLPEGFIISFGDLTGNRTPIAPINRGVLTVNG